MRSLVLRKISFLYSFIYKHDVNIFLIEIKKMWKGLLIMIIVVFGPIIAWYIMLLLLLIATLFFIVINLVIIIFIFIVTSLTSPKSFFGNSNI